MGDPREWHPVIEFPVPDSADVFLFRVTLDVDFAGVSELKTLLAPEEILRAGRFVSPLHQTRFVVCRAALRVLVAGFLLQDPREIRFATGEYGKPRLADPDGAVQFNVSHSNELAVIAICRDRDLGVDIEYIDPSRATSAVSSRFFTPREQLQLSSVAEDQRVEAFFRGWTRKEAYLKAKGEGLSGQLDKFDVSLSNEETPNLYSADADRWVLKSIWPAQEFAGTLVYSAPAASHQQFAVDGRTLMNLASLKT
jgi:4'-phosphopantetheinyl transferase